MNLSTTHHTMSSFWIGLALFTLTSPFINAQCDSLRAFPAQISFVHGLGTHGIDGKNHVYAISLNILTGITGSVNGVELGAVFNHNTCAVKGVQAAGVVNLTGGRVNGVQASGFANLSRSIKGIQAAGFYNHAHEVSGVQVSGFLNTARSVKNLQIAGFMNAAKSVKGVQIAGFMNATDTLRGLQIGVVNIADTVVSGFPIGLFNIVKKGGYRAWELSTADYQNIGLAYKFGVPKFYTIFSGGYNETPEQRFVFGFGFGHKQRIVGKTYFRPEIVSYGYVDSKGDNFDGANSTHLRFGITRHIANRFAISIIPSVYAAFNDNDDITTVKDFTPFDPVFTREYDAGNLEIGFGISLGVSLLNRS